MLLVSAEGDHETERQLRLIVAMSNAYDAIPEPEKRRVRKFIEDESEEWRRTHPPLKSTWFD
jgi:hypothetical protein